MEWLYGWIVWLGKDLVINFLATNHSKLSTHFNRGHQITYFWGRMKQCKWYSSLVYILHGYIMGITRYIPPEKTQTNRAWNLVLAPQVIASLCRHRPELPDVVLTRIGDFAAVKWGFGFFFSVQKTPNKKRGEEKRSFSGWWFQIFVIFTPTWGNDPIWLIFFKGVETTNPFLFGWMVTLRTNRKVNGGFLFVFFPPRLGKLLYAFRFFFWGSSSNDLGDRDQRDESKKSLRDETSKNLGVLPASFDLLMWIFLQVWHVGSYHCTQDVKVSHQHLLWIPGKIPNPYIPHPWKRYILHTCKTIIYHQNQPFM